MSYQSEDRYWTDYLRVALPVIGLLLMLALFWWWAQQFIGDDGDPNDVANSTQTSIATIAAPTPTITAQVNIVPTEDAGNSGTPGSGDNGDGDETPSDPDNPDQGCGFEEDQVVRVTGEGVRLRDDPIIDPGNILVESIPVDADLRILGDCYEEDDEGNQFWHVRNQETSQTGYVAGEFLEAVDNEE